MSSVKRKCPKCGGVLSCVSGDGRNIPECPDCGWRPTAEGKFDNDIWPDERVDDDVDADT